MPISKCHGIVLRLTKYAETGTILKCYTREFGLQGYMLSGIHGSKSSIKPSHLLALSLIEFEAYQHPNKDLNRIKELKCDPVLSTLHVDMIKMSIALFMSEVLIRAIHETNHPDPDLFDFLSGSIRYLDMTPHPLGNFPVFFLIELSAHLGFGLLQQNSLAMEAGLIDSTLYQELSQAGFAAYHHIRLSKSERSTILDQLLEHFRIHIPGFNKLKSLPVLQSLMD